MAFVDICSGEGRLLSAAIEAMGLPALSIDILLKPIEWIFLMVNFSNSSYAYVVQVSWDTLEHLHPARNIASSNCDQVVPKLYGLMINCKVSENLTHEEQLRLQETAVTMIGSVAQKRYHALTVQVDLCALAPTFQFYELVGSFVEKKGWDNHNVEKLF